MDLNHLKIGVVVIGAALLTYVFFPVTAKPGKAISQSGKTSVTAVRRDQSKLAQTRTVKPAKHKSHVRKSKTRHVAEARIEPDTTLRKEGIHHRRSGPPSKMYGGL
jgi:hypothetical protein